MSPAAPAREAAARLQVGAAALGVTLTEEQRDRLLAFLDLLERWNRAYNLTAVRDPAEMLPRHLLDSLAVAPFLLGGHILDLGTGAGLPGLPLAIVSPGCRFVLLDANGKKIRFVRQAVLDLGLTNVEAVQARVESYRPGEKFSTIVARAVAPVAELHAWAHPLLLEQGRLLLLKGRLPADELADPGLAGLTIQTQPLTVPYLAGERHVVVIPRD